MAKKRFEWEIVMQTKKWSLMVKLMTWINIVTICAIIGLSGSTMLKMINGSEKMLAINMDNLVNFAGLSASDYIWNLNTPFVEMTAKQLLENPSIESVTFFDTKEKVIAKGQRKDSPVASANAAIIASKYRIIKRPIVYGTNKQIIGHIECIYNLKNIESIKSDFLRSTFIGMIIAQIILCVFLFFLLRKTTNKLSAIASDLKLVSDKNQDSSASVQKISEEVSAASQEQAAFIQETVATLDSISTMVVTSVEGAKQSEQKADESLHITNQGKETVSEMIRSMEEIDKSNNDIVEEIKKGNERIAGIAKVIHEISLKTAVINDIVFQTKLLSFNASVEAARAGEQGKGFAVVAEEVGNLAQMSGKASGEISEMLDNSVLTVNTIIKETNENIQNMVKVGNNKVKDGVFIAHRCGKVLDEVVQNAELVKKMMNGVSIASNEQAEGIKNITSAMIQLEQTTQSNSNTANQSFLNSKALSVQVTSLQETVLTLELEIFGSASGQISSR